MKDDHQAAVSDHIFISYRRNDAPGASGRLYDWLRIAFGREHVFLDVCSIGVGKWRDKIDDALERSAVCVAVIGPRWASADNLARLHDENDMVRHELANALASNELTLVVPTLVEGAKVPKAADLPPVLQPLFDEWNAFPLTEEGWEDDTRRLIAEIEKAARLLAKPDVDTLLRDVGATQRRIAELERTRYLQTEQIDGLRRTVEDLTRKVAEAPAGERPRLAEAFAALARGDSLGAENAFEREFEMQSRATDEARKTMAEAARNVAKLALLRDITKAVSFFRKALAIEPEHSETARLLGAALMTLGDLNGAEAAFSQSLKAAIAQGDSFGEMVAQGGVGDVFQKTNDLATTTAAYSATLRLAEHSLARDPANTRWQRGLSVSHEKIGDVLVAQGNGPGALAAFRNSLAIREALAARDPTNGDWQRDLAVSHDKIGNMLVLQGDVSRALAAFHNSLAIREALAVRDPANTQLQGDLSVSHNRIGEVLMARGEGQAALAFFRTSLTTAEALAARDASNSDRQRELSVSHDKIGDVLVLQGDGLGALVAFRKGLAIAESLATRDPANTQWQRDLAVSHDKIGDFRLAQGRAAAALVAFRKSLAIREALTTRDPGNAQWQRDLSVGTIKVGDALFAQGDRPGALAAYHQGLAIAEVLAARDLANTQWQRDLAVGHDRIGEVLVAKGNGPAALAAFRKGHDIFEALAARDPTNAQSQTDVAISFARLGTLKHDQGADTRRDYLIRGRAILLKLRSEGRLSPSQEWIEWFEQQLRDSSPAR